MELERQLVVVTNMGEQLRLLNRGLRVGITLVDRLSRGGAGEQLG